MVKSITGYSDKISVQAGETIRFMVSCAKPGPYRAELVRVVCGDLNPKGPASSCPRSTARSTARMRAAISRSTTAPTSSCRPRRSSPGRTGSPCRR